MMEAECVSQEADALGACGITGTDGGKTICRCGADLVPSVSEVPNLDDIQEVRCSSTGAVVGNYACEGYCSARIWWTENPKLDPHYEENWARHDEPPCASYWIGNDDYQSHSPLRDSDDLSVHWDGDRPKFSVLGSDFIRGFVIRGGEWDADHQACWDGATRASVSPADVEGRWMNDVYGREATVMPG